MWRGQFLWNNACLVLWLKRWASGVLGELKTAANMQAGRAWGAQRPGGTSTGVPTRVSSRWNITFLKRSRWCPLPFYSSLEINEYQFKIGAIGHRGAERAEPWCEAGVRTGGCWAFWAEWLLLAVKLPRIPVCRRSQTRGTVGLTSKPLDSCLCHKLWTFKFCLALLTPDLKNLCIKHQTSNALIMRI